MIFFFFESAPQVLGSSSEPGGFPPKLHEVHRQFAVPALSLHRCLCVVGDAVVWRTVSITTRSFLHLLLFKCTMVFFILCSFYASSQIQLWERNTTDQLWHVCCSDYDSLSGEEFGFGLESGYYSRIFQLLSLEFKINCKYELFSHFLENLENQRPI